MANNYKTEQMQEWLNAYEEGASLNDLAAMEAAKGRSTSGPTIKRAIKLLGGHIRTYSETVNLQLKKRFGTNG